MIEKISALMVQKLSAGLNIADDQYHICSYGVEIFLHTLFSTVGLLVLGTGFGMSTETVVIVSIFYTCQTFGGGFHASSHLKCFIIMSVILAIGLLVCSLYLNQWIYLLGSVLAIAILLYHPLVLHENKLYLENQYRRLSRRSRVISICFVFIVVACFVMKVDYLAAITVGLVVSAVSRLIAEKRRKIGRRQYA